MADITEECLPGFVEYVIRRSGGESALRFYGHILAKAKDKLDSVTVRRAIIYETQGGESRERAVLDPGLRQPIRREVPRRGVRDPGGGDRVVRIRPAQERIGPTARRTEARVHQVGPESPRCARRSGSRCGLPSMRSSGGGASFSASGRSPPPVHGVTGVGARGRLRSVRVQVGDWESHTRRPIARISSRPLLRVATPSRSVKSKCIWPASSVSPK